MVSSSLSELPLLLLLPSFFLARHPIQKDSVIPTEVARERNAAEGPAVAVAVAVVFAFAFAFARHPDRAKQSLP